MVHLSFVSLPPSSVNVGGVEVPVGGATHWFDDVGVYLEESGGIHAIFLPIVLVLLLNFPLLPVTHIWMTLDSSLPNIDY